MKTNSLKYLFTVATFLLTGILPGNAADYTTFLTMERGFTEVTSQSTLLADGKYYYLLVSAENTGLIVGVGRYEAKPEWASEETKALHYLSADTDPVLDLSNFFTIEKSGSYIGLRNAVYDTDLFQTHDNAGYMYVNTFTDRTLDEWSCLIPTYQQGYWLFENGKYPIVSDNWACGYMGPWNNRVEANEPIALNRRNTPGDEAGHYRLFRIAKTDLMAQRFFATVFTSDAGFTEVTSTNQFLTDANYCYVLAEADKPGIVVSVGRFMRKPSWASTDTKALRYRETTNPLTDLSNFFTIEKSGNYIALRNVFYYKGLFHTCEEANNLYVNTLTKDSFDEWCRLIPTYQDGYWLLENGKNPASAGNQEGSYLGPWNINRFADNEPLSISHRNTSSDKAGHFRIFRIHRRKIQTAINAISADNAIDMTYKVNNPSFESSNLNAWTLIGNEPDATGALVISNTNMTGKAGNYVLKASMKYNAYIGASQVVSGLPSGVYEASGMVATTPDHPLTFSANTVYSHNTGVTKTGGMKMKAKASVGIDGQLRISAGSATNWWDKGDDATDDDCTAYFLLDDVQLTCKQLFFDATAIPLPNDLTTKLVPNQWYYFDIPYGTDYELTGDLTGMVYCDNGEQPIDNITSMTAEQQMTLRSGRAYFMTNHSNATLQVRQKRDQRQGSFTAAALNVDGLPNKIAIFTLNADGPGTEGTKKISQYLASKDYDIIGCSEDFNFHNELMSALYDRYDCGTVRATLSISDLPWSQIIQGKFRFDTDGLNLLWKKETVSASNESWTQWWSMTETDGNQYVRKGYRHYDLTLPGGAVIDVFGLHMDAGDAAVESRQSQWWQLCDAINESDHSHAKLILGDTNSRWTRENILSNFKNRLHNDFTMGDPWVEFYLNGVYPNNTMGDLWNSEDPDLYGKYEVVDKIIYINTKAANSVRLTPKSFRIERDYTYGHINGTDDTTPLGDHYPVVVTFDYSMPGDIIDIDTRIVEAETAKPAAVGNRWFTIDGRCLNGKPAKPGLYIHNGHKVVIK